MTSSRLWPRTRSRLASWGTAAQLGSGSSVGIVANGKAAMELQGDWDPGTMTPLTSDKNLNSQLGWFPFPSVPGGAGSPTTALGGGDGYSCTTGAAEPACADFLKYLDTPAVQAKVVAANVGQTLDTAIANFFAGQATPQSIISTVNQAAKTQ